MALSQFNNGKSPSMDGFVCIDFKMFKSEPDEIYDLFIAEDLDIKT